MASDSRLRSRGAINQAQKLFRMDRGDCCLGFCGDAQVAYPLVVQVGSALNNFIKTRTRAADVTMVSNMIGQLLNNLVSSWDLPRSDKVGELKTTQIMLAGWSWRFRRFEIGLFKPQDGVFKFHRVKSKMVHPWREHEPSMVFIGDHKKEYMAALTTVLERRHGKQRKASQTKKLVDFDYEPIEALALMLAEGPQREDMTEIGGAPQLLKIYPYANDLPIVIRSHDGDHYLLGRKLFSWEKTSYPVLDLTYDNPRLFYPMAAIPLPSRLSDSVEVMNSDTDLSIDLNISIPQ